jgi:hypothetical protein
MPTRSVPIAVSVPRDAPPMLRAIAADLRARLEDSAFAEQAQRLEDATVSVGAADTPQAVTLRIGDRAISLAHGAAEGADVSATVEGDGGLSTGPALRGADEHPELAEWLRGLLDPPAPPWPRAAERFWSVLSEMSGAPPALLVVNLDDGERQRYGAEHGRAYEIHGHTDGLLGVLTGRVSLLEAAYGGTVYVRGSFPEVSVLTGAGFAIRFGGDAGNE